MFRNDLSPVYYVGQDTPVAQASCFDSIAHMIAEDELPLGETPTLDDISRVSLIEMFHPDPDVPDLEAITFDGRVVAFWGDAPIRPIDEYHRCLLDAERAAEASREAAR